MSFEKSIIYASSDTLKSSNQDHTTTLENISGGFNAVLVADGIGGMANAKEASEFVVRSTAKKLENMNLEDLNFELLFYEIQEGLDQYAEELLDHEPEPNTFASTLILAVETEDKFIIAYVGNGAILHGHGNLTTFASDIHYLPWVCHNYLVCHSISDGVEKLNRNFGYKNPRKFVKPSIIEITKENDWFGDILIICSDGLYSQDQIDVAKDEDHNYWQVVPTSFVLLWQKMKDFLLTESPHIENLRTDIQNLLHEIKETPGEMSDDCTIGVIVTEQAVDYQEEIKEENVQHNN